MKELKFRVWHKIEKRMYFRGYQKLLHVLLCEDDRGANDWKGKPVKRASYEDCEMLESTTFMDKRRLEVYEGDIVKVNYKGRTFTDVVSYVPDMFGSKRLHPLESVLKKNGITGYVENLDVEVVGNKFENPELSVPAASKLSRG